MFSNTHQLLFICALLCGLFQNCKNTTNQTDDQNTTSSKVIYPSDVMPFMDQWKILLGDGTNVKRLKNYSDPDFFYVENDGETDWVVFKTPNSGVTSRTSSNTRSELGELRNWTASEGGHLEATLKVQHVSTSGDARVAATYSVVVGQIHSGSGHENEPLKIFYKKFPGHTKGSVFWNYEINTEGSNDGRWDYSEAIWGYDMATVGSEPDIFPNEPADGIELGEEFSYDINVVNGIMYLEFKAEGHPTKTFKKNLIKSDFTTKADIPLQTKELFGPIGRDGVERADAYTGEIQYFKLGAYNQTNGKSPKSNMVWCSGADTYDGDIPMQYAHGDYVEVWFKSGSMGPAIPID